MNVFISWSGSLSFEVAKLLKKWLKCVLQGTEPWISSDDIERGSLWFNDVTDSLKECNIGIVCLTKSNITAPWILFEAGSLLKGLASNRVCTFLIDLEPKDVTPPLSNFNHTIPSRESVYKLVSMLNDRLDSAKLDNDTLEMVFNTYWSQFESSFTEILSNTDEATMSISIRTENDILTEILYTVRGLESKLNSFENLTIANLPVQGKPESISHATPLFQKGDIVEHVLYGMGRVDTTHPMANDALLQISFENETKRFMQNAVINKNHLVKIDK